VNQTALQPIWDWMRATFGNGFFEFPLYFLPVVVAVVGITGIAYSFFDVVIHRRISARAATRHGLAVMATYVGSAALLLFLNTTFHPWTLDVPTAAPTLVAFVVQVTLYMVIGEFLTYWWHRLEHGNRLVFKYVHYKHHSVQNPLTIWTNFVVHPVEGFMVMVCLYIAPLALGAHPMVMVAYAIANTTAMVVTHSGYDLRFYPRWLLPPASGHELHHSEKRPTNLSVVMSYGDRLFGTYRKAPGFAAPAGRQPALIAG